jgi:hypothetical protein
MQTVASQNRKVTLRALRSFFMAGELVEPGTELQMDYINARGFQSAGKAVIVADPVLAEPAKAAAKKGK